MKEREQFTLRHCVKKAVQEYFTHLDGQDPVNLYDMVLQEVEIPLFESVLDYTNNNKSKAAEILGITRATLRKKLQSR